MTTITESKTVSYGKDVSYIIDHHVANFFEIKAEYDRQEGAIPKIVGVSELYAVNAESFTEAEARVTDHITSLDLYRGQLDIRTITRTPYRVVLIYSDQTIRPDFYRVKTDMAVDSDNGKTKHIITTYLTAGGNTDIAKANVAAFLREGMFPEEIISVAKVKVRDVLLYELARLEPAK